MKDAKILRRGPSVFFPRVRAREINRAGFTLELRDTGDAVPVEVRLRHVLKRLLRDYAFRCERIAMAAAGAGSHVATAATISSDPQDENAAELQLLENTTPAATCQRIDPTAQQGKGQL